MKLYIFNKQDGSQSADFYENEITEDILWSGESWEQFTAETGLSQAELGGIVKEKGKLVFSIEKKAEHEQSKKPLAMGTDLIKFINKTTVSSLDDRQAIALIKKVQPFMSFLEQGRCNPLSRKRLDNGLEVFGEEITNGSKDLLLKLISEWAKAVRFVN